ncbi:hypothetical protein LJC21_02475 [Bacteroides sp. OttesenSCG-928-E20]|nr:hypothetical protein [Bacteroides sp. OttesenSCG-928-N06]MDL2299554.1 hypothetical protein [Bacteroides sp. OttesenSCG-928-E20]MDL2305901.1 hypothetical protein [Bacteroides sp. OttesenSCG-928-D19]
MNTTELELNPFKRIPGLPYTHEERMQNLREALAEDPELEMSHEDFKKEMSEW